MGKKTVHVVLNSHLEPVWLWNLEQGVDAALATARTACDILDDYPEAHITRGEAWFYETVERYDPATFRRMLAHVAAGRLHPNGGWYIQPDCNLASPETYRLHAEVSLPYFRDVVGAEIRTGYNVDSFGHGAFLPDFYAAAGIENYILMRPQPHEKELPGEVFRWRSPSGAELLTARIPTHCASTPACVAARMEKAAEQAGAAGQGLFFCGVGDHGGGPAREEIEFVAAHRNAFPGVGSEGAPADFGETAAAVARRDPGSTGRKVAEAIRAATEDVRSSPLFCKASLPTEVSSVDCESPGFADTDMADISICSTLAGLRHAPKMKADNTENKG